MRRALVLLVLAVAAALSLPASAAATLVYTTQPSRTPPVLWSAFNDGSGAIRLGSNYSGAKLSPDGTSVLAVRQSRKGANQLFLLPTAGGGATLLLPSVQSGLYAWSPSSQLIAAVTGKRLVLIDVATDGVSDLAAGVVTGLIPVEWSATGLQLLANYGGQDTSQAFAVDPLTGDAHDLGATPFDGTAPFALSHDGTTVLAQTGGVEGPGRGQATVTIPFAGGPPAVLVPNGLNPDWNA